MTTADRTDTPVVSVIVPTTCETRRRECLERAINSIQSQKGVTLELILVVNGDRVDTHLLSRLRDDVTIRVIQLRDGDVSRARLSGIHATRGEFFCFLDDDDEFLQGALQARVERMRAMPDADVVATNGLIREVDDEPVVTDALARQIRENPPMSFLTLNWFPADAALFRKSRIDFDLFDFPHKHLEWTFLFFKLVSVGKTIDYLHEVTYRIHAGTPRSASKTDAYVLSAPRVLLDLLQLPLNNPLRFGLKRKLFSSLNAVAQLHLRRNRIWQAWAAHVECLARGGWRFIPYTRILLRALLVP